VVVLAQVPPQSVCPSGQVRIIAVHAPSMHDWPAVHALPQAPQWLGFARMSTQVPSHSVSGDWQRGPVSMGPLSNSTTTSCPACTSLPPPPPASSPGSGSPVLQPIPTASASANLDQRIFDM
jgi:hypothetical protein